MPSFGASQSVSGKGGLNSGRFSKMCMRVDGVAESPAVAQRTGPSNGGRPTPRGGVAQRTGPNISGPFCNSQAQQFRQFWILSGVTRDSTGGALGSCIVDLFLTEGDLWLLTTTSDPTTGAYSFSVGSGTGTKYYVVAYKVGSPDVAGTSVNILTPVLT